MKLFELQLELVVILRPLRSTSSLPQDPDNQALVVFITLSDAAQSPMEAGVGGEVENDSASQK